MKKWEKWNKWEKWEKWEKWKNEKKTEKKTKRTWKNEKKWNKWKMKKWKKGEKWWKKKEKWKNGFTRKNPRRFPGFTVVVVTFFVKILDDVHDLVSECVSFPRKINNPFCGVIVFFRRKVSIFIGRETKIHFSDENRRKKSLRSAHLTIIILLE